MTQEGSQYHPRSMFQYRRVESVGQENEKYPQNNRNRGAMQERPFLQMRGILKKKK